MNIDSVLALKDDPAIRKAVNAAPKTMSAVDVMEQRISYVYGSLKRKNPNLTRDRVRRVLQGQLGVAASDVE